MAAYPASAIPTKNVEQDSCPKDLKYIRNLSKIVKII